MSIRLCDMELYAFRSFVSPEHVEFPSRPGLYLLGGRNEVEPLVGANGTGKSSLWGALCWALYDRYPNGLRSTSMATWDAGHSPGVTCALEVDGVPHTVTRTWKPNKLLLDGEPTDQEVVENLIQCDMSQFLHSVYIGQGAKTFLDYSSMERASFISTLLNLDVWDRARDHASKTSNTAAKQRERFDKEVERLNGSIDALRSMSLQEQIDKFEEDRKSEEEQVRVRLNRLNSDIAKLDSIESENRSKNKGLQKQVKDKQQEVEELQRALSDESRRHKEALSKAAVARNEHEKAVKDFDLVNKEVKCPTCGSDLLGGRHVDIRKEIEKQMFQLAAQYRILDKERKELAITVRELEESLQEVRAEYESASRTLATQTADARAARVSRAPIVSERDVTERKLRELETRTNPFEMRDRERRKDLGKHYRRRGREMEARDTFGREAAMSSFWSKGFGQIRLEMIGEVMKRLENECAVNLTDLGLPEWHVEFSLDRENKSGTVTKGFHAMVHSPHNEGPVPFEAWSGGEAQRLRLAVAMGLSDMVQDFTSSQWNFEVWDEPCTWLSTDGIVMLLDALKERARRTSKVVWLVDHRSLNAGSFDGVATVVKDEHGSQFLWEE